MPKRLIIPSFSSEAEDAEWHQKHKREIETEFLRQVREGTTFRRPQRNPALRPVTIRLSAQDLEFARKLAAEEGVGYQTYIRMLLHQALRRKAARR
jgi:predicted DNA binding CopG/RHH family protein